MALTLTPALAASFLRDRKPAQSAALENEIEGGFVLRRALGLYESGLRSALRHRWLALATCALVLILGIGIYQRLESEFLPPMDEGGFVIDYVAPWGTSLEETDRQLRIAEKVVTAHPDIESYSRRTGAALGFEVVEPNTGDFLIKLKARRKMSTEEVISDLRKKFNTVLPDIEWEFPRILGDLIGDLTSEPQPIEIKLFSTDIAFLKEKAPQIEEQIGKVKGVVDTKDGLVYAGPSLRLRPKPVEMKRFGFSTSDLAAALNTAMLGVTTSSVLEGDRVIAIRALVDQRKINRITALMDLPLRTPDGTSVKVSQIATIEETPGQLELHRDNLRQNVAITVRLEGRDLGSAIADIQKKLSLDKSIPAGSIEYGGLFLQQQ